VLDLPQAPKVDGYFLLGLRACQQRVELRRAYTMMRAVQDAFSDTVPEVYFQALYDDPEEAKAMHELHKSRVSFQQMKPSQPISEG
jgi:hypothetical protein